VCGKELSGLRAKFDAHCKGNLPSDVPVIDNFAQAAIYRIAVPLSKKALTPCYTVTLVIVAAVLLRRIAHQFSCIKVPDRLSLVSQCPLPAMLIA